MSTIKRKSYDDDFEYLDEYATKSGDSYTLPKDILEDLTNTIRNLMAELKDAYDVADMYKKRYEFQIKNKDKNEEKVEEK